MQGRVGGIGGTGQWIREVKRSAAVIRIASRSVSEATTVDNSPMAIGVIVVAAENDPAIAGNAHAIAIAGEGNGIASGGTRGQTGECNNAKDKQHFFH